MMVAGTTCIFCLDHNDSLLYGGGGTIRCSFPYETLFLLISSKKYDVPYHIRYSSKNYSNGWVYLE